jgi:hypothetical protein
MTSNSLEYLAVSDKNVRHLSHIEKGMSEREVMVIMHKPYRYEVFEFGQDVYDVWFYVTKTTILDQTRMVPQNLTPLTFKNGILVGKGYDYYNYLVKMEDDQFKYPQDEMKEERTEDVETEKALQASSDTRVITVEKPAPTESEECEGGSCDERSEQMRAWDRQAEEMQQQEEEQDFNFW